jgi:hypothetical protein
MTRTEKPPNAMCSPPLTVIKWSAGTPLARATFGVLSLPRIFERAKKGEAGQ